MKFAEREEWEECFATVMESHFAPAMEAGDAEFEDILDIIGPEWEGTLWGCAFEDFLTMEFDVPGENLVDEYLKRRSWREKPPAKAYMKALRSSIMSLYEVSDVVPGKSMKLRDLLRGTEPVTVTEISASQSLKLWDRIATRVVEVGGKNLISGGLLPFSFRASDVLFDNLKETLELKKSQKPENLTDEQLQQLAPLFTLSWLFDVLDGLAFQQNPSFMNSDGKPIKFHDTRFPFASGVTQKQIAVRLNRLSELEQEDSKFWNWLERIKPANKLADEDEIEGQVLDTVLDDGRRVLGNIELKGKTLILSVNSTDRADLGREMIEAILGDLVRTPLTEIRTIQQMMEGESDSSEQNLENDIPPEIAKHLIQQQLDKHYRETLDLPVPALDNKTPRQAVKTKAGRQQVIEWLKYLENRMGKHSAPDDPMADYDFGWLWEELGIDRSTL